MSYTSRPPTGAAGEPDQEPPPTISPTVAAQHQPSTGQAAQQNQRNAEMAREDPWQDLIAAVTPSSTAMASSSGMDLTFPSHSLAPAAATSTPTGAAVTTTPESASTTLRSTVDNSRSWYARGTRE